MNPIVLRFLLEHGHTLDVVININEAKQIMHGYQAGTLKDRIGGHDNTGRLWSVDVKHIQAMLTIPVPEEVNPGIDASGYTPPFLLPQR